MNENNKKILVINGHPSKESFCFALSQAYQQGAQSAGAEVREINVGDLRFSPNLSHGYRKIAELEEDLIRAQDSIRWAEHLVFVYPTWWGSMPALLKGFIDRTFLPGFAFKYRDNSPWWDRMLTGRSGRLIVTMDAPVWFFRLVYGKPGHNAMKKMILEFCGIQPVKITSFGSVKRSSEKQRAGWLENVKRLGRGMQ
jgi:NAD(P)H dehydrogenase (quinone)